MPFGPKRGGVELASDGKMVLIPLTHYVPVPKTRMPITFITLQLSALPLKIRILLYTKITFFFIFMVVAVVVVAVVSSVMNTAN